MRKDSGDRGSRPTPRVAVIGGGFAGIAAGVMLQRAGIHSFTIFEKMEGIGGTWWHNRYPGAEVDTPSMIYSLSFQRFDWSRTHARQPELQDYLVRTVRDQGLAPHLVFQTEVTAATWDEEAHHYELTFADGHSEDFDAVIAAVGFLNRPSIPQWPGMDLFTGQVFHSARWPEEVQLTGKRVAVVGTGSTAVQIVGELAGKAELLSVFQRQPNWILPKLDRAFTPAERVRNQRAVRRRMLRFRAFVQSERGRVGGKAATEGAKANTVAQAAARDHLMSVLGDRPELVADLLPDYPFNGKRPVINDTFYPALRRPDVTLVPRAVTGFTDTGVVDASGDVHPVDIVVLATGFHASEYLKDLRVTGRDGRDLHQHWDGEPEAFAGVTVPGFPNLFILYGPNTNAGPVPMFLENQARFAAKAIRKMWRSGADSVDTDPAAMRRYNDWVQGRLARTVWGTTASYFTAASGKVVTQWPTGATQYLIISRVLRHLGLRYQHPKRPDRR